MPEQPSPLYTPSDESLQDDNPSAPPPSLLRARVQSSTADTCMSASTSCWACRRGDALWTQGPRTLLDMTEWNFSKLHRHVSRTRVPHPKPMRPLPHARRSRGFHSTPPPCLSRVPCSEPVILARCLGAGLGPLGVTQRPANDVSPLLLYAIESQMLAVGSFTA